MDLVLIPYWHHTCSFLAVLHDEIAKVPLGHYLASIWTYKWSWTLSLCGSSANRVIRRDKKTSRIYVCIQSQLNIIVMRMWNGVDFKFTLVPELKAKMVVLSTTEGMLCTQHVVVTK